MAKIKLATGVWQDAGGISLIVTIDGKNYEGPRQPLGTGVEECVAKRQVFLVEQTRRLKSQAAATTVAAEVAAVNATTLRGALPRFLKVAYGVTEREAEDFAPGALRSQRARDQRRHLLHWCEANDAPGKLPPFGQRPHDSITTDQVSFVLNRWKTLPPRHRPSAWTLHHRRAALMMFYDTVNTPSGYNPVRATKFAQPKDLEPRGFDYEYVERILRHVPDYKYVRRSHADGTPAEHGGLSLSKIALRIMCSTGLMCAEQDRITRHHLNLKEGTLLTSRRKAGRVVGERKLKLLPESLAAFQLFHDNNMYGNVPTAATVASAFATALPKAHAEAIELTGVPLPLPDDVRPTDFRHCFGSLVFDQTGGNEKVTGEIMGHAPGSRQTARYVRSKVTKVVLEATAKVATFQMFKTPQVTAATATPATFTPKPQPAAKREKARA